MTPRRSAARRAARPVRTEIAWDEIAARVEASARAISGAAAPDPASAARILEERARALAVRTDQAPAEHPLELLVFTLGGRAFAVESRYVLAAVRDVRPTPLPGAAPPVAAVIAWRGRILTTLDLRAALAAPPPPGGQRPRLLVLGERAPELGLLVDGVEGIQALPPSALHAVPEGAPVRAEYLRAMTPDTVPVLDAGAILRIHAADA